MKTSNIFKRISIGSLMIWVILFALIPFLLVIFSSFLLPGKEGFLGFTLTLKNYFTLFHPLYFEIFWRSFTLAAITAAICLVIGYPFAYILAKLPSHLRPVFVFLMIIPFWTSSLIRIYAMIIIIRVKGLLNHFLLWLGVIHHPFHLLYTQTAVLIGLVYALLPFMVLPLYSSLEKFDWQLIDSARDLGASRWRTFWSVIIPITTPGIVAGIILVLLPAMTLFYIPNILGGAKSLLLGNLITLQFIEAHNWPLGSAVSVMLTIFMAILLIVYWRISSEEDRRTML